MTRKARVTCRSWIMAKLNPTARASMLVAMARSKTFFHFVTSRCLGLSSSFRKLSISILPPMKAKMPKAMNGAIFPNMPNSSSPTSHPISGIPPWNTPNARENRSTCRRSNVGCSIPTTQLMAKQSIAKLNDKSISSIHPIFTYFKKTAKVHKLRYTQTNEIAVLETCHGASLQLQGKYPFP